ncbi:hypothetical protein OAK19_04180 [Aureispira]|nr:hypothetical protein [Aureispira sp.]
MFFSFAISLLAQSATNNALDKACDCLKNKNFDVLLLSKVSLTADSCIQDALYTNLTGVLKENNATLDDSDALFKLAQLIHVELSKKCRGFQKFSTRIAEVMVKEVKNKNPSDIGLLYKLNTEGQFPVFTILTQEKKAIQFIWLQEFDGSSRFMNGIQNYQNTIVEIVWKELELYDPQNKTYPYYKEILMVEELRMIDSVERKAWINAYNSVINK